MFDGWFRTENMMKCIKHMINIGNELSAVPCKSVAEIAVVAEGKAMYRARKSSGLATTCLINILRTLAECGAPYHLFSMCDLADIAKEDYKLYLFVNQYDISDENKKIISELFTANGKTAVWLYAPDYASAGALDVNNIKNLTEINVEQSSISHGAMMYNGQSYNYETAAPYFSVNDDEAKALAYYEDGTVAAAHKGNHNYVASCNLPSELLRNIAETAGVFLYSRNNLLYTYANSETVGVFNAANDDTTLYVKSDGLWYDMISGKEFIAVDGKITIPNTEIHAFLLRKKQ